MSHRRFVAARLSLICAVVGAAGCAAGDQTGAAWAGTVDTLPGGALVVRNPPGALWDSATAWRFEEELRVGSTEGDEPGAFAGVNALLVDPAGRMYVLDRQLKAVQLFAADGAHLRTIGREGGGPGEFADPVGLGWDTAGALWVVDPGNARYAMFDTSGRHLGAHRRLVAGYSVPWRGGFDLAGYLYDPTRVRRGDEGRGALVRQRLVTDGGPQAADASPAAAIADGAAGAETRLVVVDTVYLPPEPEADEFVLRTPSGATISTAAPFAPSLVWRLDPRRGLWAGTSDAYRVVHRSLAGDTLRVIERDVPPPPATDVDRAGLDEQYQWFTRQGGRIDLSRVPSSKPHFDALVVDDLGNLWVRPVRERDAPGSRFDVFDADGRYLGAVETPLAFYPWVMPVFAGEKAYAVVRDELDVSYVVRLRLVKP